MQLGAPAEVLHRLPQLGLDDRVDDDRGPALRAVDDEAEVVHRLDARMADLLERLLGELRLERGDEPRGGFAGRVRDDVELDGRDAHLASSCFQVDTAHLHRAHSRRGRRTGGP